MSDNEETQDEMRKNAERQAASEKAKHQEKRDKELREQAEEEQRRRDEEAAEEEAKRRRAADAARMRQQQAAAARDAAEAAARDAAARAAAMQQKNTAAKPQAQGTSTQMQQSPTSVTFSPEPPQPKSSAPRPEPDFVRSFKNSLKDEDEKRTVNYDAETGQLNFSGEKGLDALLKFMEANPGVKVALVTDRLSKDTLRALRDNTLSDGTSLLDQLSSITINGKVLQGNEMRRAIQSQIGPPRPSATSGKD